MRLAIVASHPIQYQAPLFRDLATRLDLKVFFACLATPQQQADAGFGVAFEWDVDLTSGYSFEVLNNVSRHPGPDHFSGCDTPALKQLLTCDRFDAVLVLGWHLKCFWQAILAAKRAGLPVLVRGDSHLGTPRSMLKRLAKDIAYPPALRVFDAALYVGKRSRDYWTHYRYPPERLFFSPHCVDTQWFAQRAIRSGRSEARTRQGIAEDARVALFAGKLVDFKRPLDLVAAAAKAHEGGRPFSILVAGSGPLATDMKSAAASVGVPLHMLGFCNQTQMPAAYAVADVLVLPSDGRETWGLVANEAQACGLPVLVSDACGCADDLAEGGAGQVFPLGDINALAKTLVSMLDHPPAFETVLRKSARYSLAAASGGIEAALAYVVEARSKGGPRDL